MLHEGLESLSRDLAQNRRQVGPQEHEIRRAGTGAGMIVTAFWWVLLSRAPERFLQGFDLSTATLITRGGGVTLFAAGSLLFCVGASRSRGRRDAMIVVKAIVWITAATALLWTQGFVPDADAAAFGLTTIYIWSIASGVTRLFLALRGTPVPRLPDPDELGMPVTGPASRDEAAEAMSDETDANAPRFRD